MVSRPQDKKVIGVKWIFKTKKNPDGSVNKLKARLVAKGYAQEAGVDYGDTFAPVARHDTIRMLLALAAQNHWQVHQLDVKSAFLNGYLQEEVFIDQPDGFQVEGNEDKVYRLIKALYGLKQAPRAWYSRIDTYFAQKGFDRSSSEATLYVRAEKNDVLIVSLYVDDLLVTGNNPALVQAFKEEMKEQFEMTDLGIMSYFLGMEISQSDDEIFISQAKYAREILKKFRMDECKSAATPLAVNLKLQKEDDAEKVDGKLYRSVIGCLLYLTATRPDLMFAPRFMQSPSSNHFDAVKSVLRYVKGTKDYGIWFKKCSNFKLQAYSDSYWAGSCKDMKSTSGYTCSFGSGMFTWNSKKQETVAQSTAEAEYIAAAAVNQVIWVKKILEDLKMKQVGATPVFVDNKSAVAIAKNPIQHGRTKHIKVKFHFIREAENAGEVDLQHCYGHEQVADILTKALPRDKFEDCRAKLGVSSKSVKEE